METPGVVIVGGGHAGFTLAATLRSSGYLPPICIVSDEKDHPYERPPLSKAFLLGTRKREALRFRETAYYSTHGIEFLAGVRAEEILRADRRVLLSTGGLLAFDHLVIATGARNRLLPIPGGDLCIGLDLRSVNDAHAIAGSLAGARNVVVIGGGFIGLEIAAVAAKLGKAVTVVEAQDRLLARAAPRLVSAFLQAVHVRNGVHFRLSTGVHALVRRPDGRTGVETSGGSLAADLVIVGIGVVPNTQLAAAAGLAVDDGILVDAGLCTSDPGIFAIGDCARYRRSDGVLLRLESVQNATDQARYVASRLLGKEQATGYAAVPWFWSDQYDCKLQIAGLPTEAASLAVKEMPQGQLAVASVLGGDLVALHTVNAPGEHMFARKRMANGAPVAGAELVARGYALG